MKNKGSYTYTDKAEDYILKLVDFTPRTTNQITSLAKMKYFSDIHYYTIKRLLEKMFKKGAVKKSARGKYTLWTR